ncbi:MAG: serine/threonine protein kinase, partial [Myxococcales bacterium]|nr:serine/threonine protein kinase [Myxococcales bacterium]
MSGKASPDPLVGTVLADRYRILALIGVGAMGAVYRAEHVSIGKTFAIKVLSPKLADKPEFVERFLREAKAASRIQHANVVEITDFGDGSAGVVFMVMELLEGEDLRRTLKREGALPWPRVRHIMTQIGQALDAAHGSGVVHRDMKPDNCFRTTRGGDPDFIKILDFG